jgi:hypothetical protein
MIRSSTAIAALVAAAVSSVSFAGATADYTLFQFQVSPAGQETWSSSLNVLPGAAVDFRVRVSYIGDTFSPIGLGGAATFQPLVSNWTTGDVLAPFANIGGNTNGGAVPDAPGQYGRVLPWAKIATSSTDFLRGHINTNGGTTYLRIAKNQVTSWLGGSGNTTGNSGVQAGQLSNVGRTVNDPPFNPSLTDLVVFKVKLMLDPSNQSARTMQVFALDGWVGELSSGVRSVNWYASMSEAVGSIRVPGVVEGATVNVVPTPGTGVGMLLLTCGALARRRR